MTASFDIGPFSLVDGECVASAQPDETQDKTQSTKIFLSMLIRSCLGNPCREFYQRLLHHTTAGPRALCGLAEQVGHRGASPVIRFEDVVKAAARPHAWLRLANGRGVVRLDRIFVIEVGIGGRK
jgi:hypothetical protein